MKILNLSIGTMIFRLHAMSALVVTLGFLGLMYVGIVLGVILFLATLMGIQWKQINPFRHVPHPNDLEWQKRHQHHHPTVH
jgi:hypothetical protein